MGDLGESDEWATVETESEDSPTLDEVHEKLSQPAVSPIYQIVDFVLSNGWFIVAFLAIAYFVHQKMREKRERASSMRESAEHHKDPAVLIAKQEAMEAARRRMQEMYDAQAAAHAEKIKEKEEAMRRQKLEDWERHKQGLGYRSKTRASENDANQELGPKPKSTKPKLRPEYNPLMGDTGGACFRAARRTTGGG